MNKTYYCLGNGERGCDGCAAEKNWQSINELPNEYRIRLQSNQNFVRVDDTECILRGRPYYKTTAPVEPVKQEPVYAFRRKGQDSFCTCDKERYEELADKPTLFEVTTFYAAPVRTKDLTDDEIAKAVGSPLDEVYLADFRAVIAKFKEKNR